MDSFEIFKENSSLKIFKAEQWPIYIYCIVPTKVRVEANQFCGFIGMQL